jgi:5-methylcytosine-specific restriction protein A
MFYDTPAWRKVRLIVLARDEGICQLRGPRCRVTADQVDHIVRPADGGAWYDETNLRAACGPCNASRGGKASGGFRTSWKPSREW